MAEESRKHVESQGSRSFVESDLEPGVSADTVARGEDAALYEESEGAQTATNRSSSHYPIDGTKGHGVHGIETVLEGSLDTRAPGGEGQGITSRSASEESAGQKKVVADRPDAQSAINQSKLASK